ncbi:hypothetical protein F5Y14DRAFT_422409 [Nemania sp. NC0429]|nr:hypothetical protein F5Y14DRAFT_422409 [Nemania sp. NC0429]
MARLSLVLFAAALTQMVSSLPIVEGKQVPNTPTEPPTRFPTELQAGPHVDLPHPHPHILQSPLPASKPALVTKRNLPVTPEWLRWLPFESINM